MNVSNLAFYIGKSSNRNVIIYSFNIENGQINQKDPLKSYWIMRENNNMIEDLNFIEKSTAYGHTLIDNPVNNNDIPFKIISLDDIMLIRKQSSDDSIKYNVIIVLDTGNGPTEYILKKVFLHLSGPMDQTVNKIDYIYEDPETNKLSTFQRIIN